MIEVKHTIIGWIFGLGLVSLVLGSLVSYLVWNALHGYFSYLNRSKHWNLSNEFITTVKPFPVLIGISERLFFTLLVAFQVTGVAGGIIAWIGVKMAVGWGAVKEGRTPHRALAFTGLLSSLVSLLFAVVGGLICNGAIPVYKLCRYFV